MNTRDRIRRALAWALTAALINPAAPLSAQVPPNGVGDFTLYTSSSTSGASEPNILLIIDTSDSMNIPEAWREYPGAYDSHVEYLWNDLNRIVDADAGSSGEVTSEDPERISTAAASLTPSSPWGTWGGATLADRRALWQAARAYAKATQPGDPGARSVWRDYDDLSWIYWLPAGTGENDPRLRSPSWNRFRGYVQKIGGDRYVDYGSTANDYRSNNQCTSSLDALTPSTVFAPTNVAENSGKYLDQEWLRWEPWKHLTTVGNDGYPGSSTAANPLGDGNNYTMGYLDASMVPSGNPSDNPVYRDNTVPGGTPVGSDGLPIRYDNGSAGAGWSSLKADMGGFNFRDAVDAYSSQAMLDEVESWYGLPTPSDVDASGSTDITDSKFIAWKGNRDAVPAFGMTTGVSAYADATPAPCDALSGPESATCLKKSGQVSAPVTVTKDSTCTLTGSSWESDAVYWPRTWGGECTLGPITCNDPNGPGVAPDCDSVPDPVCKPPVGTSNVFYDKYYYNCAFSGGTPLTVPDCSLQNVQNVDVPVCKLTNTTTVTAPNCQMIDQLPINVDKCTLQGASSVAVSSCSAVGGTPITVGTCAPTGAKTVTVNTCAPSGGGNVTVNACGFANRQTATVNACQWQNRNARYIEGIGFIAYGGTCEESGSSANCQTSSNLDLQKYPLAYGPYSSKQDALASEAGCSNTVAAGTVYNYGGSCEESGSPDSCAVTGGIDATIGGQLYHHVNGSCGNTIAPNTYAYGYTCEESGSPDSCQTGTGTSMTIRGTRYDGIGATCTNTVAPNTYTYGITCEENNSPDSCATSAGTSMTIRGQPYDHIGATCSNTVAAGVYTYGQTCEESGSPANCSSDGGSSITIRNTRYDNVNVTCSNIVSPGAYTLGGTCEENNSAASCQTSPGISLPIGGVNHTDVNRTCTQIQAVGSYLTGGTCSPSSDQCNYTPGGEITIRNQKYENYGATCTNKDAAPGTYTVGGDGCATNPTSFEANCKYDPGVDKWIDNTLYHHYGASCTDIYPAGSLTYGGDSCAGLANNCNYDQGTTVTIGTTDYQNVGASCSNKFPAGTYAYGEQCTGTMLSAQPQPTPGGLPTMTSGTPDACVVAGTSELIIGGKDYGAYGGTCATKTPAFDDETCQVRYGGECSPTCSPPAETSYTGGGGTGVDAYYRVFNQAASQDYLVHDCLADEPDANPGGGYMTQALRPLGTAFNTDVSPGQSSATASYTSSAGLAAPADESQKVDMYSVNYLNWKFGPKGPNGDPIGRKSRLQITKDALTNLVETTNGVRFGLMVFNKTADAANNYSDEGGNIVYKITDMGPKNCSLASASTTGTIDAGSTSLTLASNPGFGVGDTITVPGAGPSGTDLTANITNIAQTGNNSTLATLSAPANTSVAAATISVPECTASEAAEYANRLDLISRIDHLSAASRTPLTESLYEAYLYFRGEPPLFGRLTTPAVTGGAVAAGCDKSAFATPGNGPDCTGSSGNYVSPMMSSLDPNTNQPAACSKNFTIMMTDGGPEDDFSANAQIKALSYAPPGGGATVSPLQATVSNQFETGGAPYGPVDLADTSHDNGYVWLDELSYYMANGDMNANISGRQPVNTYTIGFAGADSPVLANAADKGGGQYYLAQDAGQLSAALTSAVAAIREWNPTLTSPTIPVSALNRSESASDVYLAFFGPSSSQAWAGTVKKFMLGQGATDCGKNPDGSDIPLCLIGKTVLSGTSVKNIEQTTTDPLTDSQTVVVNPAAVSFWNPSNIQDGSRPNKGGTGQALLDSTTINPSTRNLYTFITDPGPGSEAVSTNADLTAPANAVSETSALVTKTRLGDQNMSDAQRATLINFIRGGDTSVAACSDSPSADTPCTTWRGWPHDDVMHSKPAIVTYDPTPKTNPESGASVPTSQYLFYLSNDGLLHAVNAATGKEAWSFLVEEALPEIKTLSDNLAGQHLMLADGDLTTWVYDANGDGKIDPANGDKVYLYFGLRRGGRAYYALDITKIDDPQFLWKIAHRSSGGVLCKQAQPCTSDSDYDELGYTWSAPVTGRIRALSDASTPAVIFGGGYDGNEDNATTTAADTMGRAVYVVNGLTGEALKVFENGASGAVGGSSISGMYFSIPSTVAALNSDLDSQNYLDRVYVGDMAANLWRFDINDADPAKWTAKQLAALSDSFALPNSGPDRKIMIPPVVVKQNYQGQDYDAVYVGTGDREHPLLTTSADKMFMIKDFDLGLTASQSTLITYPSSLYDISSVYLASDFDPTTFIAKQGWYQSLQSGEKVFTQPTVFYNVLRYTTFDPEGSVSACVPSGKGLAYAINAQYGGSVPNGTIAASTSTKQDPALPATGTRGIYSDPALVVISPKVGTGPVGSTPTLEPGAIYILVCSNGICKPVKIGTIGGASKTYWYRGSAQ